MTNKYCRQCGKSFSKRTFRKHLKKCTGSHTRKEIAPIAANLPLDVFIGESPKSDYSLDKTPFLGFSSKWRSLALGYEIQAYLSTGWYKTTGFISNYILEQGNVFPCKIDIFNGIVVDEFKNHPKTQFSILHENFDHYGREEITFERIKTKYIDFHSKVFSKELIEQMRKGIFIGLKAFLPKLNVSDSFLLRPNQFLHSTIRGKLPKFTYDYGKKDVEREEIFKENIEIIDNILAEMCLDLSLVGFRLDMTNIPQIKQSSFKDKMLIENNDLKKLNTTLIKEKSNSKKTILYKKLIQKIKTEYRAKIQRLFNPTVIAPIYNPYLNLQFPLIKDATPVEAIHVENIINAFWNVSDRIAIHSDWIQTEKLWKFSNYLYELKMMEQEFLTSFLAAHAVNTFSPIFKLPHSPYTIFEKYRKLSNLYDNINWRVDIFGNKNSNNYYINEAKLFMKDYTLFVDSLEAIFPKSYLKYLKSNLPNKITLICDLPLEWIRLRSNVSLSECLPFIRMPLTPLDNLIIHNAYGNHLTDSFPIKPEEILLASGIEEEEKILSEEVDQITKIYESQGIKVKFEIFTDKEAFLEHLIQKKPKILGFYGHSGMIRGKPVLLFGRDSLSINDLDTVKELPKIVFLAGCNTSSSININSQFVSYFLRRGTTTVLGYHFKLKGFIAGLFIGRLITIITGLKREQDFLSNIIYYNRRLSTLQDYLLHARNSGLIDFKEYAKFLNKIPKRIVKKLEDQPKKRLSIIDILNPFFVEAMTEEGLKREWKEISNYIIPFSRFFTIFGLHDVIIEPNF